MHTRRRLVNRWGAALAAATATLALAAPLAGAASHSSATESAFCHTILTVHPTSPKGTSFTTWRNWAKTWLPYWQKLASEAPTPASKQVLTYLVTIVKYESTAKNYTQIGAYVAAHAKWWSNGWKSFATDVEHCALSAY